MATNPHSSITSFLQQFYVDAGNQRRSKFNFKFTKRYLVPSIRFRLHRGFYNGFPLEFLDEGFEDSLERIEKFIKEVPQMKLHPKYVKEFEAKQVKWAEKKKEAEEWHLGNRMKPATLEEMNQKISKAERKKWAVKQYATIG
jgi:hypothetical protein